MFINMDLAPLVVIQDQETTLWENSDPTSAFSAQDVTLSDDITNYDELKVIYKASTSDTVSRFIKVSVNDFLTVMSSTYKQLGLYGAFNGNSWCRVGNYVSNTSINFGTCYRLNTSGNNTSVCVPVKIIGIKKELNYSKDYSEISNNVTVSSNKAFVDTNITPKEGMIIEVISGSSVSYDYSGTFIIKDGEVVELYSSYIYLQIDNNKLQVKQTFSSSAQTLRVVTIE